MDIIIESYIDTISGKELEKITCYCSGKIKEEHYYLNNRLHREDGPAYICNYENGKVSAKWYCLNGLRITDPLEIDKINSKLIQKNLIQEEFENKNINQTKKRKIFIIENF